MSVQRTLDSYFNVRKRPFDQHAAKRRKIEIQDEPHDLSEKIESKVLLATAIKSETPTEKTECQNSSSPALVVTSVFDDHHEVIRTTPSTPPKSSIEGENHRSSKRDVRGQNIGSDCVQDSKIFFTIGKNLEHSARKKLDLSAKGLESKEEKRVVSFHKLGSLSPKKTFSPRKDSPDSRSGSPAAKSANLSEMKATAVNLLSKLQGLTGNESPTKQKMTPQEIKAKLGTVTKLSDLQMKLKSLHSAPVPPPKASHKRALFSSVTSGPKLSQDAFVLEVVKEKVTQPPPSPVKASPRKAVIESPVTSNLSLPDKRLPLPRKYRFLAEVFKVLDQIVSMKHNRKEVIRVIDVKPAVQNVLRRNFTDEHLKQIRCIFPQAYDFTWERVRDRMGRETNKYELHMQINFNYTNKKVDGVTKEYQRLTPVAQVERLKIFKHNLLTIVQDHHRLFLQEIGIPLQDDVMAWHRDFDVETLPDVDSVDFPPHPITDRVTSAQEMIQRLGTGVNPRLESVLNQRDEARADDKQNHLPQPQGETENGVKILKGLQGLPPHLLELLKAKEKAKQVKKMLLSTDEEKELEMMRQLIDVAPVIINCYRSQRNGAAVPSETLFKVISASHGKKSAKEIEQLVRLFVKLLPDCMEFKTYEKVEYAKLKMPRPNINEVRNRIEKLVAQKKN